MTTPSPITITFTTALAPEVKENPRVVARSPVPRVAKSLRYVTPHTLGTC